MMLAMDEAVGKLLAKLKDEKLEENTLVVFFSDNGGPTMQGTTINGSANALLRGSKRTTLEGGVRVPFCIKWPAKVPAGKVYDKPIIQLDVLPTALAAAGVETKADWKLDGVDLLPYLTGETKTSAARRTLLAARSADGDSQRRLEAGEVRRKRRRGQRHNRRRSFTTSPTTSARKLTSRTSTRIR